MKTIIEIPLIPGKNIADWYNPKDLPEALVAWEALQPTKFKAVVGLYMYEWKNPQPHGIIDSIEFVSSYMYPTPVLVAITAETQGSRKGVF